ncbi:SNF2 family N-terminal domain-containing protein [Favolaschia claudopus]|uniref:SNF2 family N-terminal domain-containing protein n=1 Tax=Favolaschia claudopus TaxID=2862362 RepID=A0AAV9ZF44_9AGAR
MASPSPSSATTPLPTASSSSSCSTPARMWSSSIPPSTAPSSPPEVKDEDGDAEMHGIRHEDDESPFLRAAADASSPPYPQSEETEEHEKQQPNEDQNADAADLDGPQEGELTASQLSRLENVLQRSSMYSAVLKQQMDDARVRHAAKRAEGAKEKRKQAEMKAKGKGKKGKGGRTAKRRRVDEEEEEEDSEVKEVEAAEEDAAFPQPESVTGTRLKDYQLEGLQWMVGLHEQGISGILADEMGLGKTLQTIAFAAHLREQGQTRPFLVVCPLSVMHNWVEEFGRFAPGIPTLMYHGTPAERAEMRRTVLALPEGWPRASSSSSSSFSVAKEGKAKGMVRLCLPSLLLARANDPNLENPGTEDEEGGKKEQDPIDAAHDEHFKAFPVVITTYDLVIRDRGVIGGVPWGYIVVDEGHRLKNMHCALMREIKKYSSAGRMVLTGTPLHNNLAELWSLLNFILPDIFDDVEAFQEWFSLPRMSALLPSARMGTFISTLHTILKPFLLRRVKADVLGPLLPPKKSYVLYARMSAQQAEAYAAIMEGGARRWVAGRAAARASAALGVRVGEERKKEEHGEKGDKNEEDVEGVGKMRTRRGGKRKGEVAEEQDEEAERVRAAEAFVRKQAAKHVNNQKLQNTVMQLRKVCSHPSLFADPGLEDPWADEAELLGASGKMLLLDRLLGELFRRGHKVLLFSQFTTMLDIIEDWAVDMKGWRICRIDGTTPPQERRDQMNVFQSAGDAGDAPRLFLLSTRSGGLGVNLTAADTVIFYDQDWNPQMDVQAQDRAHRIGQTKPVLIFRLVTATTIEEKIMEKAGEKRKLEALVIAKGKFQMPVTSDASTSKRSTTMAEMAADLLRLEGERVLPTTTQAGDEIILSDADLEALLDRSPEVFADRGTGWRSSGGNNEKGEAAFAVFEPPVDAGSEVLSGMMGEESGEV